MASSNPSDETATPPPPERPDPVGDIYRGRGFRVGVVVLLVAIIFLSLLPEAMRLGLRSALERQGLSNVTVRNVDFNVFTGVLLLEGISAARNQEPVLKGERIRLRVDWWPLWKRRAWIRDLRVQGFWVLVERTDDRPFRIAGMPLPPPAPDEETAGMGIGIATAHLEDVEVTLRDPASPVHLVATRVQLRDLISWKPQDTARFTFTGQLNEAPLEVAGDLNAFTEAPGFSGHVQIQGLDLATLQTGDREAGFRVEGRLSVDTQVALRTDPPRLEREGEVHMNDLSLTGDFGNLKARDLRWNGNDTLTFDGPALAAQGELEIRDLGGTLLLNRPGDGARPGTPSPRDALPVETGALNWQGKLSLDGRDGTLQTDGTLMGRALKTTLPGTWLALPPGTDEVARLEGEELRWQGRAGRKPLDDGIRAEGVIRAKALRTRLPLPIQDGLAALDASVGGEQRLDLTLDKDGLLRAVSEGRLVADRLDLQGPSLSAGQERLQWQGTLNLQQGGNAPHLVLDAKGRVDAGPLNLELPERALQAGYQVLGWGGHLSIGPEGETPSLQGDLQMDGLNLREDRDLHRSLRLAQVVIQGVDTEGVDRVKAGQLKATDLSIVEPPRAPAPDGPGPREILKLAELTADTLDLPLEGPYGADAVRASGLVLHLQRQVDRTWLGLPAPGEEPAPGTSATTGGAPVPGLRLGRFELEGENQLWLTDLSVRPPFESRMAIQRLVIKDLDSTSPDRPASLDLDARIEQHARLRLSGTVQPFQTPPTLNLEGRVEALELPPFSSYTANTLGYTLNSGQFNAQLDFGAEKGKLKGQADLEMANLDLKTVSEEDSRELTESLGMPLDAALALLKDKGDNIHLTLPIGGDLENPDVDFSDAINQAIGKAMRGAAVSYLTVALQPFGAIVLVARVAGKISAHVDLQPVTFQPGGTSLDATARAYAGKLASLLQERPKLRLKVCGLATPADRDRLLEQAKVKQHRGQAERLALAKAADEPPPPEPEPPVISDERLVKLAQARAEALKNHLIEEHGVSASRLFLCRPSLDTEPDKGPRTELKI